ncbi:tetratricopeptide repeat protein, partial [Planktomarina sp.]|nr:tetratricopeptide repeat protein [Planktomarina sp.]
ALAIKPDYAEAFNNIGNTLKQQDKLEEAIEAHNKALAIKPEYAEAYSNIGVALKDQGKLEEAIEAYNKALAIKPDYAGAHYNSSFALLNSGRLKEGLDAYEWRWKTAQFKSPRRHFLQPLWDGKTSLQDQRILVWCEQGVGDTIIWSSRLSLLVSQAGHCILECQKKLVPLLSRSFPNVEVKPVDVSRDTERDDFDFHLPMASLYRHFIPEITRSPKPDAFLMPDPVRVKFWKDSLSFLGGGPYVGISWKSSLMGAERSKHFSSLSEWSSLLTLPNINFINLQYADAADGLLQIQNEFGVKVHNFDDLDQYNDLDNVAALSAALDCVVSFGTSVPMITAGVGTLTKCPCLANGNYNNILGGPIGPLVDKFEKNTSEPWSNVFGLIADDISKL